MIACISKNFVIASKIQSLINLNACGFIAILKDTFDYSTLVYIYNIKSLKNFVLTNIEDVNKKYFLYDDGNITVINSDKLYTLKL